MDSELVYRRYCELQRYVGWTEDDAARVRGLGPRLAPHFEVLVDDFYEEIERHPEAQRVITGGPAQIERLKGTLRVWLAELLSGCYDSSYVERRWRVGWRHVEIGLAQVYTNAALSRLRGGLMLALRNGWDGTREELDDIAASLGRLLDLDLAIIEEAYQAEYSVRLQRAERLATLGQMAGGIAHELRNPLNVVKTSVYYLLNARNPTPEKRAEHLRRVERQVEIADRVITALASFARMPVPDLRPVELEPCVREALESDPPGDGIAVELSLPEGLPRALADAEQLRIVLGNLFRNARDAMPQGGRLSIAARPDGNTLAIDIRDTGEGIPREHLARITEPLYSTKARGLGLGLAICRAILEKSRGNLRVESEPGQGSMFTVILASAPARAEDGSPGS